MFVDVLNTHKHGEQIYLKETVNVPPLLPSSLSAVQRHFNHQPQFKNAVNPQASKTSCKKVFNSLSKLLNSCLIKVQRDVTAEQYETEQDLQLRQHLSSDLMDITTTPTDRKKNIQACIVNL